MPGASASEHWEFTARFDSGHLLFAEFLITNIGPGEQNAAAIGYIIDPDGKSHRFSNGRRKGSWRLSSDRLHIEVGASGLDLHAPTYQLRVSKRSVRVDLHFRSESPVVWSEALTPSGYMIDLLALAVPIEGTLWVKGMREPLTVRGTVAATHSWMNEAGSTLVLRRLEFFTLQQDFPLYGLDLIAPDGKRLQWLVIKQQDHSAYQSHKFELALDGEVSDARDQGYEVPGVLRFKDSEVEGQLQLERVLLRADPFIDLPQPFRFLVQMVLNLRPRRVWALSPFAVSFHTDQAVQPEQAGTPLQVHGTSVITVTFLNPMPTSHFQAAAQFREVSRAP